METNKIGNEAVMLGSIVGGNVLGAIATNKVKALNGNLGRVALLVAGLLLAAKSKSDILKGASIGVALSGVSGFVQQFIKGVAGFDGIEGLMGVNGNYGVGDIIQGPDGMMYMVNGLGELEVLDSDEYYLEDDDDVEYYLEGSEDVQALASVDDNVAVYA